MNKTKVDLIIEAFPECTYVGERGVELNQVTSIQDVQNKVLNNTISWIGDKYVGTVKGSLQLGLLILSKAAWEQLKSHKCNFLISENPRATFAKLISLFFSKKITPGIEKTAVIHESVQLGKNIYIGHNVVIEAGCSIGDDTAIMHNTVILEGTSVGKNVTIGCNCTIGNYGFGYEKNEEGDYLLMEHLGRVIINDAVEIHNNTCIDKGVLGATIIHENVKIDNLVHIAHGVIIERNALIIANAMLGGSCIIGENTWIAPSTSIKNKIQVKSDSLTGIGAVVLKDFEAGKTIIGNPATTMEEYKEWSSIRKKLMQNP